MEIIGADASGTRVLGNFIGLNLNGSGFSNIGNAQDGVRVETPGNFIGGTATGASNVISGNDQNGVHLLGSGSTDNEVSGNFMGTDRNGTADFGNSSDGAHLERNVSKNEFAGNTISGNGSGVEIFGAEAKGNEVLGNFIGTNVGGAADLGNSGSGVFINAPGNFISATASGEGNTIAFNGQEAVVIAGVAATGNRILDNSIFSNGGQGIDFVGGTENAAGATQNDAKDPDTGPNTLHNKPVLDSATTSGGSTIIEGRLNSTPNRSYHHPVLLQPLWQRGQDVHP